MSSVATAWVKAARSLARRDILWHMLWPTALAFAFWIGVAYFIWDDAARLALRLVQAWPWVGGWFVDGSTAATMLAGFTHLVLIFALLPLSLLTTSALISIFALPLMLDRVAASDYPDLAERRGGTQLGSVGNAVWAVVLFVFAALCTLPLWFIPGVGLVLSVCLGAWLNQRSYRYDALMRHADRDELRRLPKQHKGALYLIGGSAGLLVFVPGLNFFVPALTGLAFVHYLLQALREARATSAPH